MAVVLEAFATSSGVGIAVQRMAREATRIVDFMVGILRTGDCWLELVRRCEDEERWDWSVGMMAFYRRDAAISQPP